MSHLTLEDILERYPLCLRSHLKELASNDIGMAKSGIKLKLPPNKSRLNFDINHDNSIFLDIPYAGRYLSIEVIFTDDDFSFAPDFDVLNDPFLSDPDVDLIERDLPSLMDWSLENPKSLTTFIHELIDLYRLHHVEEFFRVHKQIIKINDFQELKKKCGLDDKDVEIYMGNNIQYLLISLKLDYSNLPEYIHKKYFIDGSIQNPGIDRAILKVNYSNHRRNEATLQLSPRLEFVFNTYSSMEIPSYDMNKPLVDFVQLIKKTINNKINSVRNHFENKEKYISLLLSLHGDNIIEYDNISFTRATFWFEIDLFACFVTFSLSNLFPIERPSVTLRSVYRKVRDITAYCNIKSYPFSPDWEIKEMVDKVLVQIREEMLKFKINCSI